MIAAFTTCGCDKQERIESYAVPRHDSLQTSEFLKASGERRPHPERMLAAIVPHGSAMWFFKLQGPPDAVAGHETEFREFLNSIQLSADEKLKWSLPSNWQEKPGNEMRYATLVLSDEPPLEVTVTTLSAGPGDMTDKLLANVNRWRGQLDLPGIEAEDLPSRTETIKAGDVVITLVDYVGKVVPKSAMSGGMPPMMGAAQTSQAKAEAQSDRDTGVKYNKPADWTELPPKQFQLHRFEVVVGQDKAEIAISRAGGARDDNINRWRGQLGLKPLTDNELKNAGKPIEVGSKAGELIEITTEERTILGVMIPEDGQTWFIKLTGATALAAKERARFEEFVKSIRFE